MADFESKIREARKEEREAACAAMCAFCNPADECYLTRRPSKAYRAEKPAWGNLWMHYVDGDPSNEWPCTAAKIHEANHQRNL